MAWLLLSPPCQTGVITFLTTHVYRGKSALCCTLHMELVYYCTLLHDTLSMYSWAFVHCTAVQLYLYTLYLHTLYLCTLYLYTAVNVYSCTCVQLYVCTVYSQELVPWCHCSEAGLPADRSLCVLCSVYCAVCAVCTVHFVQYVLCSVYCAVYTVHMYCAVCTVQCVVWCEVFIGQFAMLSG